MTVLSETEAAGTWRLTAEAAWAEIKSLRPVVEAARKYRHEYKTAVAKPPEYLAVAVDEYEKHLNKNSGSEGQNLASVSG